MEQLNITISDDIKKNLQRMRELNAIFKTDEFAEEELYEEYRTIQSKMVSVFIPIVELMVKAELITVNIEVDENDDMNEYTNISGDPTCVFDNGNIWIDSEHSGGCLKQ